MSNSTSLFLSPNPSTPIENPAISPVSPQTGTSQFTPPPPDANQLTPPPADTNQLTPPSPSIEQLNAPPPDVNQLISPPPDVNQLSPPPLNASQWIPPPPTDINQLTPPPPIETNQFILPPSPDINQLTPPPPIETNQFILPPSPDINQLTPPPPPDIYQLAPPTSDVNQLVPPPSDADQFASELMESRNESNPLLNNLIGNQVPVSASPTLPTNPVQSPVAIPSPPPPSSIPIQPLTPHSPLSDPSHSFIRPAASVPAQVQTPPSPSFSLPPVGFRNPSLSPPTNSLHTSQKKDSSVGAPKADTSHSSQAAIVIAFVSAFVLVCLIFLSVISVKRLRRNRAPKLLGLYKTKGNNTELISSPYSKTGSNGGIPYQQLYDMTAGFSGANLIGEGGFARVYKGVFPDRTEVAVKQIKQEKAAEMELRSEVEIISRIHHRHLVKLLGYCLTEPYQLLVYEFIPNRTLSHHLHEEGLPVLDWQKRVKIAISCARGLKYLHEDCEPKIVHRDIKSANILLDYYFEPKLADFGIAKVRYDSNTHVSTRVMGTHGYLAPEYGTTGKLTYKSDVFSFGVVLLELITGRKAINPLDPEESLVGWAWPLLVEAIDNGNFENLVDPKFKGYYVANEVHQMINLAAACVRHSSANRPSMAQVLKALESGCNLPDLCNGVQFGESTAFDSKQYSVEIENFQRREFGDTGVSILS